MKSDLNREFSGCIINLVTAAGATSVIRKLCGTASERANGIVSGKYWSAKNHTPPSALDQPKAKGSGKNKMFEYRLYALDVISESQHGVFFFAPYFTLANETIKALREKNSDLKYERINLNSLFQSAEKTGELPASLMFLGWGVRIEGDGDKAKLLSLAGNDLVASQSYSHVNRPPDIPQWVHENMETSSPTDKASPHAGITTALKSAPLIFKHQRVLLGFSRLTRPKTEVVTLRKHELKLSLDIHGNIRIRDQFDDVAISALKELIPIFGHRGILEEARVCPLYRKDETEQARA